MKRRLFNLLTAFSLLLCVAAVALWAASNFFKQTLNYTGPGWGGEVKTPVGSLVVVVGTTNSGFGRRGWRYEVLGGVPTWRRTVALNFEGFRYERLERRTEVTRTLAVPFWFISAMTLAVPAIRLCARVVKRRLQSSRTRAGLCPSCRYDRRATPGRCPECGTAAPTPA